MQLFDHRYGPFCRKRKRLEDIDYDALLSGGISLGEVDDSEEDDEDADEVRDSYLAKVAIAHSPKCL